MNVAKQNRSRGKNTEKAVAGRLGGKRVGLFGGQDIEAGAFSIEAKDRKAFAGAC
jgi:hypothetical protein